MGIIFVSLLFCAITFAQNVPQGMNYQAVARDAGGAELSNQALTIKLSLLVGSSTGTVSWQETHSVTTNNFGLFSVIIGEGTSTGSGSSATFSAVNWGSSSHFVKVELDAGSGLVDMGTTKLMSVPYALSTAGVTPTDITDNAAAIATETAARISGDSTNAAETAQVQTNLNTEAATRATADNTIQADVNQNELDSDAADSTNAAETAQVQTNLNTEAATRASADNLKANIASPTFTGTVTIPTGASITAPTITGAGAIAGVFTGNLTGNVTGNVTGSAATVTTNANLTGVVTSTGNATAIADAALSIAKTSGLQTALDAKAPLASPTFTGTVGGITSTMVGLGNVDNTSDLNKPVSTAGQAALDLKAPLASPTFTGTVAIPSYADLSGTILGHANLLSGLATKPLSGITNTTIASATATGAKGSIAYDASYVYICIATNSWIRIVRAASW